MSLFAQEKRYSFYHYHVQGPIYCHTTKHSKIVWALKDALTCKKKKVVEKPKPKSTSIQTRPVGNRSSSISIKISI